MITIYEFERLKQLIREKNNRQILNGDNFSFDEKSQKIIKISTKNIYEGVKEKIDIFQRLKSKYQKHQQFEAHLQAYILQNIEKLFTENIEWIGNEVVLSSFI